MTRTLNRTAFPERFGILSVMVLIGILCRKCSTQTKVPIRFNNFKEEFVRLLTDPRLKDTDFDFFDNDPLAGPPAEWKTIGNANTGRAYRSTWKDLVKNPGKEVAWGILMYQDGTETAQFSDLTFHAVKFSFVNFTEEVSFRLYPSALSGN